jgi:hypothetical protein
MSVPHLSSHPLPTGPLPPGFEALEPFVLHWAIGTTEGRLRARAEASMDEIRAFYDAMVPLADAAMNHVDAYGLADLSPERTCLATLVLSLAQAAVAVEIHGAPRAPGTPYPNSLRVLRGAPPLG